MPPARLRLPLLAAAFVLRGRGFTLAAPDPEPLNTGQDVTRPLARVDMRAGYSQGNDGTNTGTFILRHDRPVRLGEGTTLGLRVDLPVVVNDAANASGERNLAGGLGDVLVQALVSHALDRDWAIGAGAQLTAPSAMRDRFGGGRWRAVPTAGVRYSLTDQISPGSFALAAARYDVDFAGESRRPRRRKAQFSPTVNVVLPERYFVTLLPSTDIRLNTATGRWFVPANVAVGRVWPGSMVASAEIGVPIIRDYPVYDVKAELRVGFFS
jgi:hypothetical protein